MKKSFFYLLLVSHFFISKSFATHIVGGEMNYLYLGNSQYQITFTIYRDCYNGQAPFDDPAAVGIFDGHGNLYDSIPVYISQRGSVPNAINSPCLDPPVDVCYEYARYIFNVTLPAGGGSYTIAYQRCCRNYSIINIDNVQNTGATYMTQVTDPLIAPINSNPVFNDLPPTFICRDAPFTFDHAATDPDGDSLVYELCFPFEGGNQINRTPNPPAPPPYNPVTFLPPYSVNDPLGGMPLEINASTGILKATPNNLGQYVYGISVKEYRNGVYLGETRRDFQVNVVSCPELTVASILSPTIACGSLDANFVNNSYHGLSYSWNFGDGTVFNDTSSLKNPVYTYPDTGDYWATLIAYSPENSLCNDTVRGLVHVYPSFLTRFYITNYHCSNRFSFYDQSFGIHGNANFWQWDFGDNTFSSDSMPVHDYAVPGNYQVSFMSSADSACLDTMTKTVHVLRNPVSDFSLLIDTCKYSINAINNSQFAASSRWDYGDNYVDYPLNGSHNYYRPGDFDVQLIVSTDSVCVDTSIIHIHIPPLPIADFDFTVLPCDSNVNFTNRSANAVSYFWNFGDDTTSLLVSPAHTYSLSGKVPVLLAATSLQGCETEIVKNIFFISSKIAAFEAATDSCSGVVNFYDVTENAAFYYWDFGDGTYSGEKIPIHKFEKDGDHNVLLSLNRESQCADSIGKKLVYEAPLGEKVFIPNSFTPNGDGHNDLFHPSIFRPCEIYKMTIYNRWGQIVFESDDAASVYWDGMYKGDPMPQDIYVFILKGEEKSINGFINIQR